MTTPAVSFSDLLAGRAPLPIVLAPMAGGPSRPELVAAAADAGVPGFLAAGYRSCAEMRHDIAATRALTPRPFGVNVFVPTAVATPPGALDQYLRELLPEADRYGVDLGPPLADDDGYRDKIAALVEDPVAAVSFTFGAPTAQDVRALRSAGSQVIITINNATDATAAARLGPDALCVQGSEAGGHHGAFANEDDTPAAAPLVEVLAAVRGLTDLPLVAAGGITTGRRIAEVLGAGAVAAQIGTLFLRAPEAGTKPTHRAALADPRFATTMVTRALTGRPARGLRNRFMIQHLTAPAAYPAIHHVTAPIRAAAAELGDPDGVNLWAGTGWRDATDEPVAAVIERLGSELDALRSAHQQVG